MESSPLQRHPKAPAEVQPCDVFYQCHECKEHPPWSVWNPALPSLQYSYLLSSQLESQRRYFEEKMARIEKDLTEQVILGGSLL